MRLTYLPSFFIILFVSCTSSKEEKKEATITQAIDSTEIIKSNSPLTTKETDSVKIVTKSKQSLNSTKVDKNYLLGKFNFAEHPDFVQVDKPYTSKPKGEVYLRKETYEAFMKMSAAAEKEGIKLVILSGARNFDKQKSIWDGKWKGKYAKVKGDLERAQAILKFSAMPCTSRHHWGTDIDLNDLNNSTFEKGKGKEVFDWMTIHAHEYGFCNVYSAKGKERSNGYEQERWHWSYLPLAKPFLAQYLQTITLNDITGFEGSESKDDLDVIQKYVGGIAKNCE